MSDETVHLIGYFAAICVFVTFCMGSAGSLRSMALVSNFAFLCYGVPQKLWPIVVLHGALVPINTMRLVQSLQLRSDAAREGTRRPSNRSALPVVYACAICALLVVGGLLAEVCGRDCGLPPIRWHAQKP